MDNPGILLPFMDTVMKYILIALALFAPTVVSAAPTVTFAWDAYPVDSTHNTGANKFILETKMDSGTYIASPAITPITTTSYTMDLAGRTGNVVTGHIKACRPGTFTVPPQTADECSNWSNEVSKTVASTPPAAPSGLKLQ